MNQRDKALYFVEHQRQFHLGCLPTEQPHPVTTDLSETIGKDIHAGIRMLLEVDKDIVTASKRVFAQVEFRKLVDALCRAFMGNGRVFFTGCGATGRLSILLESCWRRFWQEFRIAHPNQSVAGSGDLEDRVMSVMAGGDFALIKSVEGFEDFTEFGKQQISDLGVGGDDVVVAITEGGETSFVIGTAWRGIEVGAEVFFVYNNPTDILRDSVERSREVLDEPMITNLDLSSGPMAIAGSTRMQATTIELLVVGAAMEIALSRVMAERCDTGQPLSNDFTTPQPEEYPEMFAKLLNELSAAPSIDAIANATDFERNIYTKQGLVTYAADVFVLDILTDTTERSPTFSLPPFRKCDDFTSQPPWACVQNLMADTPQAWLDMLRRIPRGLEWDVTTYAKLNAPENLQTHPPKLGNAEIYKFRIGCDDDPSRYEAPVSALIMVLAGNETDRLTDRHNSFNTSFQHHAHSFGDVACLCVGPKSASVSIDQKFHIPCNLPRSTIRLWDHLAIKIVLNTISTATMALMNRVIGNWMVYVQASNKKLIDRSTRLISDLTGLSYEDACIVLHESITQTGPQLPPGEIVARLMEEPLDH